MIDAEDIVGVEARRPAWSEVAEQSVLGALLLDNAAFDKVGDILSAADFYDGRHRAIYGAIAAMLNAHKVADVVSVFEQLRGNGSEWLEYLNSLSQCVPSAANARRHAGLVREKSQQRQLVGLADEAMSLAWGNGAIAEKVEKILDLFTAAQNKTVRKMPRRLADIVLERTAHYEAIQAGKVLPGWRTHIPRLTNMLNGGFRPGHLYILAARPAVGKSSLAGDLGLSFAADDLPTLFLSQEMPEAELADRAIANKGRIDSGTCLSGKMEQSQWGQVLDGVDLIQQHHGCYYVDEQAALSLAEVRSKVRSIRGLKVLILDYLQLCSGSRKDGGNRNSEIEEISRGLKSMAKEFGIAILALSQLNRQVESRPGKRPNLGDLRDSGAIEQDADVVLLLWPVREFDDRKIVGCDIAKNRQGRTGEFGLDFYGSTQRWVESTADISPPPATRKGGGFE